MMHTHERLLKGIIIKYVFHFNEVIKRCSLHYDIEDPKKGFINKWRYLFLNINDEDCQKKMLGLKKYYPYTLFVMCGSVMGSLGSKSEPYGGWFIKSTFFCHSSSNTSTK